MKFRKKPVVIEATQWFKNGDHPEDDCHMVHPDSNSTTQFEPFLSEGKVVRYFRHPNIPGTDFHREADGKGCNRMFHDHGFIDTLESQGQPHTVCPGDWIITGIKGEKYPCKDEVFRMTYEAVDE